jgi:glycosyltransferase involved in cell wall biosynthesis
MSFLRTMFSKRRSKSRILSADRTAMEQSCFASDHNLPERRLEIVIPTYNSASWLPTLIEHYRRLKISPLFLIDSKTQDLSRTILADNGQRFVEVYSEHPKVESLLQPIFDAYNDRWLLRFDDDEFPDAKLIAWLKSSFLPMIATATPTFRCVGFRRGWIARCHGDDTWYLSGPQSSMGDDRQYRLVIPSRVKRTDAIHSPGFHWSNVERLDAPPDAVIYHADWILKSRSARESKIALYNALAKNQGNQYSRYYLPENHPATDYDLQPIPDGEITDVASRLWHNEATWHERTL